jgi:hypothetical protein
MANLQDVVGNDIVDLILDNCKLIKYQDTIERNEPIGE